MNSNKNRLISGYRTTALAAVFALLGVCAAHAQVSSEAQNQAASTSAYGQTETMGSVTEPQGENYVAPSKLNPKLARITLYRPSQGFTAGVVNIEINGHYHTSLQLGAYKEVCIEPAEFRLAAHMVQTGAELKNYKDATATLKPQAAQNLYIRVFEYGDGRATITPVRDDIAIPELKNTRHQIHAVTRVTDAKECIEPEASPASAPRIVKNESIVLSADALFAFGKADVKGISAQGRDSLDELIGRLQKEYGSDDNALIQITGHADPLGKPVANKRLSEARALAIRNYFIQGGMNAKRITGQGQGDTKPVITTCGKTATPESIECNKPNRRVVVSVQVTAR